MNAILSNNIKGISTNNGEWEGIKSKKFHGGIKILKPIDKNNVFSRNLILIIETTTLLIPGKKHFTINPSVEQVFKPEKKLFTDKKRLNGIESK